MLPRTGWWEHLHFWLHCICRARSSAATFRRRFSCCRTTPYGWAICWDDILIGTVGAYDYESDTDSIELGVSIARNCWGKGFGSEAVNAVITFLMEHEGISCVRAWCAADNIGSARIMEKAGMRCVRVEEEALEIEGKLYDKRIYEKQK